MTLCTDAEDALAPTAAPEGLPPGWPTQVEAACARACQMIAPAWPLDRAIAVNPHWSRIGMPLRQVAARMAVLGDVQVFPSRPTQQLAWEQGRIDMADL
ncbi:MAG TPA: Na-translocating system protein MpsB, partial [Alicycliphilus sp.]|nr:Na-translocating system protein MpsB [Alicycliphilus sp.]